MVLVDANFTTPPQLFQGVLGKLFLQTVGEYMSQILFTYQNRCVFSVEIVSSENWSIWTLSLSDWQHDNRTSAASRKTTLQQPQVSVLAGGNSGGKDALWQPAGPAVFPIDWPTQRRYHFHFSDCPEGNKYHLILGEAEGAINWPVVWGWRLHRPAPEGWLPTAPGAPWPWPWGRCGLGTCPWAVCACAWWGCGGPVSTHDAWGPLTASRLCACNTCTFTSHYSFFWHRCASLLITAMGNLSLFIWVKSESLLVETSCTAHPTDSFQRLHITLLPCPFKTQIQN